MLRKTLTKLEIARFSKWEAAFCTQTASEGLSTHVKLRAWLLGRGSCEQCTSRGW